MKKTLILFSLIIAAISPVSAQMAYEDFFVIINAHGLGIKGYSEEKDLKGDIFDTKSFIHWSTNEYGVHIFSAASLIDTVKSISFKSYFTTIAIKSDTLPKGIELDDNFKGYRFIGRGEIYGSELVAERTPMFLVFEVDTPPSDKENTFISCYLTIYFAKNSTTGKPGYLRFWGVTETLEHDVSP